MRQPEHFQRIGVSASVYAFKLQQRGQNGSPPFAANRSRLNVSNATASVIRMMPARLSVRAAGDNKKC